MWGRSKARSYAALVAVQKGDFKKAFEHFEVAKLTAQQGGNPSALLLVQEVEGNLAKTSTGGSPERNKVISPFSFSLLNFSFLACFSSVHLIC